MPTYEGEYTLEDIDGEHRQVMVTWNDKGYYNMVFANSHETTVSEKYLDAYVVVDGLVGWKRIADQTMGKE